MAVPVGIGIGDGFSCFPRGDVFRLASVQAFHLGLQIAVVDCGQLSWVYKVIEDSPCYLPIGCLSSPLVYGFRVEKLSYSWDSSGKTLQLPKDGVLVIGKGFVLYFVGCVDSLPPHARECLC